MDVQIQAWTNSLLHLPKPQSKHTRSFKPATHQTKTQQICFFRLWMCKRKLEQIPFCTCQNPIQTHFHLQSCYPQTKKQHCSICSARGQKLEIRAVCLAWCTNVECACTPPEAELQRSADENIRGHKHCVLHSARTVHAQCTLQCTSQCTATKRCKYHVFSQK